MKKKRKKEKEKEKKGILKIYHKNKSVKHQTRKIYKA
jgi:hypothetical protein